MNARFSQLHGEGLLLLSGPDSLTFLQGQTTCDTRELSPTRALPGAYCTPQGRVVCDFLLLTLAEDSFALRMRASIAEQAAAVFGKYIVFSKADITPAQDSWCSVGIWGQDARAALTELFGTIPDERYGSVCGEDFAIVQLDDEGQMFECALSSQGSQAHLDKFGQALEQADEPEWQVLQVSQGIARIETATVEEFVPQSLNYDLTGHISFSKGCYTGQEVVARLHYRGTPKRRTRIATLADGVTVAPGDLAYVAGKEQSVGDVVNVAAGENGPQVLLSVAEKSVDEALHLGTDQGPVFTLQALPYPLAEDTNEA